VIRATLCRLRCPEHGVLVEAVSWAAHESRFTLDFEDLVAWLSREMNQTAVTRLMHISWTAVGRIVERVVARKLDKHRLDKLYEIGLDEVSYRKGHKYLSIVADHRTGDTRSGSARAARSRPSPDFSTSWGRIGARS
jgi:transposase